MCTFVWLLIGAWENVRDGCAAFLVFRVGSERILKGKGTSPTVGAHGRQGLRDGRRRRGGVPLQRLSISTRQWPGRARAWPGFAVGQRVRERKGASIVESNDGARDAILNVEVAMRTTVTLDDDLLARAEELTGVRERSALIRDAVELLVRIESGRQLAALGGSDSAAEAAPRSRERA